MDDETKEEILEAIEEYRQEVFERIEEEDDGSSQQSYYIGKELGLVSAKNIIREVTGDLD